MQERNPEKEIYGAKTLKAGSKSNIVALGNLAQFGSEKIARSGHKSEDISESVSSFHPGAIFLPPLGQKRFRGAFVGSIPCPGQISLMRTVFGHDPEMPKFHGFSESSHEN